VVVGDVTLLRPVCEVLVGVEEHDEVVELEVNEELLKLEEDEVGDVVEQDDEVELVGVVNELVELELLEVVVTVHADTDTVIVVVWTLALQVAEVDVELYAKINGSLLAVRNRMSVNWIK